MQQQQQQQQADGRAEIYTYESASLVYSCAWSVSGAGAWPELVALLLRGPEKRSFWFP